MSTARTEGSQVKSPMPFGELRLITDSDKLYRCSVCRELLLPGSTIFAHPILKEDIDELSEDDELSLKDRVEHVFHIYCLKQAVRISVKNKETDDFDVITDLDGAVAADCEGSASCKVCNSSFFYPSPEVLSVITSTSSDLHPIVETFFEHKHDILKNFEGLLIAKDLHGIEALLRTAEFSEFIEHSCEALFTMITLALEHGNLEVLQLLFSDRHVKDIPMVCLERQALNAIILYNSPKMFSCFMSLKRFEDESNYEFWGMILNHAADRGHVEIFFYAIERIKKTGISIDAFSDSLKQSIEGDLLDLVQVLIKSELINSEMVNFRALVVNAVGVGINVLRLLTSLPRFNTINHKWLGIFLKDAVECNLQDIVKHLLSLEKFNAIPEFFFDHLLKNAEEPALKSILIEEMARRGIGMPVGIKRKRAEVSDDADLKRRMITHHSEATVTESTADESLKKEEVTEALLYEDLDEEDVELAYIAAIDCEDIEVEDAAESEAFNQALLSEERFKARRF